MERYQRLQELGRGSYGAAVLVRDRQSGKHRVVKEIDLSKMPASAQREAKNEVGVLKSLQHPNIVAYFDAFTEGTKLCIVMEYADGGDLAGQVKKRKAESNHFPEAELLLTFAQCCLALQSVHKKKILHRDLKCQNIFVTSDRVVKLGDFGIAKVLDHTAAQANTMIGTPIYLAPEVCHSKPYGVKADIWSLGVVLYELSALEPPFTGSNIAALIHNIVSTAPKPLSSALYTDGLRELVADMLQKLPEQRPSLDQILGRALVRRAAETLPGWASPAPIVSASDGEDQTVVPGRAKAGAAPDSLEELVRQREGGEQRCSVPRGARPPRGQQQQSQQQLDLAGEFRRNREMALVAKARAEGRAPSLPPGLARAHSVDSSPAQGAYSVNASRKAAEEAERLQALQEAAAQARRDRQQVQKRMSDLERPSSQDQQRGSPSAAARPEHPSSSSRVRAASVDEAQRLAELQEAAAQARRDRRMIQQKVQELERGAARDSPQPSDNATALLPQAAGPARERLSRQAAEAEHLQALQEARLQARRDRQLIEQRRKSEEIGEVDHCIAETASGGQRSSTPRRSLEDKQAAEAQHMQALSEAASQARRDRKLLQEKMRDLNAQDSQNSACVADSREDAAAEPPARAVSPASKAAEEAKHLQALQEAAAQARRERRLLQQKVSREVEQEGYIPSAQEASSPSRQSPLLRPPHRQTSQESPELDKTQHRLSLGRSSPVLGRAGSLSLSRSRPGSSDSAKPSDNGVGVGGSACGSCEAPTPSSPTGYGSGRGQQEEPGSAAPQISISLASGADAQSRPPLLPADTLSRVSLLPAPEDTLGSLSYTATSGLLTASSTQAIS